MGKILDQDAFPTQISEKGTYVGDGGRAGSICHTLLTDVRDEHEHILTG